ncbi:LysR family transcriptional regulator [Parahaliea mediterranea]|uniref:LysR family transcriptional regulator n=1 Tax=Parahaliea mediterranea TaxID=651086 RepID=A0A939DDU1_9GAMM|nr:LysR substrate-binding domain-containing protein [Parahaliea mediterranea]MBN7796348.1 LysR family transcriptional regulator [Parahaliea mediterranea]
MELRHLRYFVAVAETLHFGRAARKLNISQPPLTQQIHNLEDELGVQLFDRSKRQVELTAEGELFLKRAEVILHQAEQAAADVRRVSQGGGETLVIGYMGSAILREIVPLLREFHARFPAVRLEFVIMRSDEQYEALLDGRIDVGFVDLTVQPMSERFRTHRVDYELVVHERLCLALNPGHALADRECVNVSELRDEPFVTLQRHLFPSNYDKIVGQCQQAGFRPEIVGMSEQTDVLLAYVAAGVGVALVPSCTEPSWHTQVSFVALEPVATVDVHLIVSADHGSEAAANFRRVSAGYARGRNR